MGDLISRAAAIEAAFKGADDWDGGFNPKYLIELPAVDAAQVRRGKWIEEPDRHYHYHCSECLTVQGVSSIRMNYCPECGALMEMHPLMAATANPGP